MLNKEIDNITLFECEHREGTRCHYWINNKGLEIRLSCPFNGHYISWVNKILTGNCHGIY